MEPVDFKEVTVHEHKYRIGRIRADIGAFILAKLAGRTLRELSEAEYALVQQRCLEVVSNYQVFAGGDVKTLPILTQDGKVSVRELEYDPIGLFTLTQAVLSFNIFPFFDEAELKQFTSTLQTCRDSSQSNSQP